MIEPMKHVLKFYVVSLLSIMSLSFHLRAATVLPALISDNMVLKQQSEVALWGWDNPGTTILVHTSWNKRAYEVKAGLDGKWNVSISTPKAGGPYQILINGTDKIELKNVLIGEVWFTSGQSNMGWSVAEEKSAENVLKSAEHENIRIFHVPRQVADQQECEFKKGTSWKKCTAESVRNFSAMSYYFAVFLQDKLNIPIGIISASWAGTGIESWLSLDVQNLDTKLKKPIDRWHQWEKDFLQDSIIYVENGRVGKVDAQGRVQKPKSLYMLERPHCKPGTLYNGMIYPCMPFTISGLVWYQGENSVEWADEYEYQLSNMIDSWRSGFGSDFPVLVGQLTNFNYPSAERAAMVRDAQLNVQGKRDTHVICTIDIGTANDVHPNNKLPFGQRFADMALNKVYGKPGMTDYPVAKKVVAQDDQAIVYFTDAKELQIQGDSIQGIRADDATGKRIKVEVTTEKNKLILRGCQIRNVVKVSYAVDNNVKANLYNEANLPAFPFTLQVEHKR